jgi:hypothetical protein
VPGDGSLRFDIPGENTDRWAQPEEPIAIDHAELGGLTADESRYGAALTRMLLRDGDVRRDCDVGHDRAVAARKRG